MFKPRRPNSVATIRGVFALSLAGALLSWGALATSVPASAMTVADGDVPQYTLVAFDHPVSLDSALSLKDAHGLGIEGYRLESNSVVGDYWPRTNMSLSEFKREVLRKTGTVPETVGVYVKTPEDHRARGVIDQMTIKTGLERYTSPPASPSEEFLRGQGERFSAPGAEASALSSGERWDPDYAEVRIIDQVTTVGIDAKYAWQDYPTYNSPLNTPEHWGIEFGVDFYTTMRTPPPGELPITYGTRPWCGWADYKDWAAASNDVFNWFALVANDDYMIVAPQALGLYGDYNDLSDPCTRSSISVGMADPHAMPHSTYGTNHLAIAMYPDRGQDYVSKIGANIQVVERYTCEAFPAMALTDCMGVDTTRSFPGPGAQTRNVLSPSRGWTAPSRCWYSASYGEVATDTAAYPCDQ